jgi:hypothetical protein
MDEKCDNTNEILKIQTNKSISGNVRNEKFNKLNKNTLQSITSRLEEVEEIKTGIEHEI